MPLNWEKVGTTIESCSNETYIIAKSVKSNSYTVGNETEVATEENKLSTPWSINTKNTSYPSNGNYYQILFITSVINAFGSTSKETKRIQLENASYLGTDKQNLIQMHCLHMW